VVGRIGPTSRTDVIQRPCLDCGKPFEPRRGVARCAVHQPVYERTRERPLQSPAWMRLRDEKLKVNPDCEDCGAPATQVQHLNPRSMGGPLLPPLSGLRSLCTSCHSRWTQRERRFGYRRPHCPSYPRTATLAIGHSSHEPVVSIVTATLCGVSRGGRGVG
jgi:5-methylcytosine-specific restriction enzyme A